MSWAAHNPEAYEECERKGVACWLESKGGVEADGDTLLMIQQNCREAWDKLTLPANKQICEAEAEYLISAGGCDR